MATKLPNGHKIYQTAIEYPNLFHSKALKNYPNRDFWSENITSGSPAFDGLGGLASSLLFTVLYFLHKAKYF
jgi:hypothetical protein